MAVSSGRRHGTSSLSTVEAAGIDLDQQTAVSETMILKIIYAGVRDGPKGSKYLQGAC